MLQARAGESRVDEQDLLYFSRVLAAQCHELANALNIAHQLCGLHEDTLAQTGEANAAMGKLGGMVQRIDAQINRGTAILRNLSRFAHSVDEPMAACDLRDTLERAVFFAARQARLHRIELQAALPEGDVPVVHAGPFRLQQLIHCAIEVLLEGIPEGGRINAGLTFDSAGARIALEIANPPAHHIAGAERLAEIAAWARAAGGELLDAGESRGLLLILIPYDHRDPALVEVVDAD